MQGWHHSSIEGGKRQGSSAGNRGRREEGQVFGEAGAESGQQVRHLDWIDSICIIQDCEEDGILPEHIVLGGFSQGAAIALLTTWRYPKTLGGCVALSGWLTLKDDFEEKKTKENNTPLFWGHGTQDPVVLPEQVPVGVAVIQDNGISVTQEMYPGMGHSSCPQEMNDVLGFIKTCFA